ncbi:MAG TPA: succinate dehydrogenase/fumarate reductase iron-sulfur subunit [Conexibacter sp.]|jgi:succinate dehydrogenase / fumarate reductase iron-sulfur subunit|nr:succinate dehydrogenase/fumarate reductase iron-sulfur subunit [Conexibacter sp.]
MAEYTLKLRRYDPQSGEAPYYEEYQVDLEPHRSVLEAILQVKAEQDGSVGIRCSCRAAICGSCGVRINGKAGLACHTHLDRAAKTGVNADGKTILVEPMGNMPVIKDLIVDMDAVHWKKIQRVTPWLLAKEPVPEREYVVPHENMVDVTQTMACIQCGACVSDCLSMEVDPLFVGPAAAAKAYRFVGDPRDAQHFERLKDLAEDPHGIYDCTHCFNCIEACPKGVAPMSQIMRLRRISGNDHHIVDRNNGERHERTIVGLIRDYGLLHEAEMLPRSYGGYSWLAKFHPAAGAELLDSLPVITRALLRRKVTPGKVIFGHRIPKADLKAVQAIYDKVESKDRRYELNLYISGYEDDDADDAATPVAVASGADGMSSVPGPDPHQPTSASESESA